MSKGSVTGSRVGSLVTFVAPLVCARRASPSSRAASLERVACPRKIEVVTSLRSWSLARPAGSCRPEKGELHELNPFWFRPAVLPDYVPVPPSALGPALNDQGYYVRRVERNLFWVTDGTYQSAFLAIDEGIVLFDAPPTIGPQPSTGGGRNRRDRRRRQHRHASRVLPSPCGSRRCRRPFRQRPRPDRRARRHDAFSCKTTIRQGRLRPTWQVGRWTPPMSGQPSSITTPTAFRRHP